MRLAASSRRRRPLWVAGIALVIAVSIWTSGLLVNLDRSFLDLQTRWLQDDVASDVVVVEIDAHSLQALGQWPLSRSMHAQVLDNLAAAGAANIFVDIDFSVPSNPVADAALAVSLDRLKGRVVLPSFWQPTSSTATSLQLTEPLPAFRRSATLGLVNLVPGTDGLVRTVDTLANADNGVTPVLPVWAALLGMDPSNVSDLDLDYRIAPTSFARLSYVDVFRGVPASLAGKHVFVGATALELGDIVAVPVHRALPGVIVQAIALQTAQENSLVKPGTFALSIVLALWTVATTWLLSKSRWRVSPAVAITLLAVATATVAGLYGVASIVVPISPFIVALICVLTGSLLSSLSMESWHRWRALSGSRDRDALLRQVVNRSSEAILTFDADGSLRTANPTARDWFGIDGANQRLDALRAIIADRSRPRPCELIVPRGDSALALEVSCAEVAWDSQRITTVTARDVTLHKNREQELLHLAHHDSLTQLPNRVLLRERLGELLQTRADNEIVALFMLDLDGFKEVNDALGHSMGDVLLTALGERFSLLANERRTIARLGGDEFALAWAVESRHDIEQLAQDLLLLVQDPILIKGVPVSLGTSIGIALAPESATDVESLLKGADVALYVAKRKRTRVEFYDPTLDTNTSRRLEMLSLLRSAIANGELCLHYQPKVDLRTGQVAEVEALCRWNSPTLGFISPGEFIPLAEASDLIKPLTEWTIRRALLDCRDWHDRGLAIKVAVNLSARHLQDSQLPHWLSNMFESTRTQAQWLELEITESAIMVDPARAASILRSLRALGVRISIDDFGTGYSSLAYLRSLAADRLKIDQSFVATIDRGERDQVIVESTIKLAHALGLEAVAEGIETEAQYAVLRDLGCDVGQGYLIAKPMPAANFVEWIRSRPSAGSERNNLPAVQLNVA